MPITAERQSIPCFGYTYAEDRREVTDWDGFAGCWFAAAAALLHRLTGEGKWLDAARKALDYYGRFVRDLNCWGTPMDTWKAVDEEGNIAFLKTCAVLWQDTKDPEILERIKTHPMAVWKCEKNDLRATKQ